MTKTQQITARSEVFYFSTTRSRSRREWRTPANRKQSDTNRNCYIPDQDAGKQLVFLNVSWVISTESK